MKIRKLEESAIKEIVDSDGSLIGDDDIPTTGSDLESRSNKTTDYNVGVGTQPFRYDMLGRFGFTLLPFFEGKENKEQTNLLSDLSELAFEKYIDILKYYYKNPNKLKGDYRSLSKKKFKVEPEESDREFAKKILKVVEKYFEDAFQEPKTIDEDVMLDDKNLIELSEKTDDRELRKEKIMKIAGLINKLDKEAVKDIVNLLEVD